MADMVLFSMSFPYIFKIMLLGFLYVTCMELVKHCKFWHNIWHKPLFSFSIYMISVSTVYWY
jgi:hypothetical protein